MESLESLESIALQKSRTWAGLAVVLTGDAAITVAAIWGVARADDAQSIAILTSAFTAVGTMTTAYFGIRAVGHTAQSRASRPPTAPDVTPRQIGY